MLAAVGDLGTWALIFALLGGIGGGFVNSVAGGGTLVTFPVLTAVGIPALDANITNAVALSPGYAGGTYAQRRDLIGQANLARVLAITSILGGVTGAALLLSTGEELFEQLVPWLIFGATALLAAQKPLRRLTVSARGDAGEMSRWVLVVSIFLATVYGGYFGAGLGIITIAILGLMLTDTLNRLNALKLLMSLCANGAAAIFFAFSGHVYWWAGLMMGVGAWAGGWLGGKTVQHLNEAIFRLGVIALGIAVGFAFLLT
ncbi:MAG: sulfite exporter TauE/SafE family protein [Actinobacteria bacterium]|nr:sulfite exporter TauE/SafE family protein [Actinomycetota bacterium]MBM3697529.1 sulfite exporter TauE/SafE family protein [Actinomycetota bacterium]